MKRIATTLLVAGLLVTPILALPPPAAAVSIGISIGIAPPPLPVYVQPVAPGPGYMWTPGYWAWGYDGYYWVPGTWVLPPAVGLLWTPGWWGWSADRYHWHAGYWGPRVGFYGGINYGFGYFGIGYVGGYWRGRDFYYNRAVNNVNITNIRNVYVDRTVVNNIHERNVRHVSYNGGRGGIEMRPSAEQRAIANRHRWAPTSMQIRQRDTALRAPAQRFRPGHSGMVFATRRPDGVDTAHAAAAHTARPNHGTTAPSHKRGPTERPRNRTKPAGAAHPTQLHATDHVKAPRDRGPMVADRPHQQHRQQPQGTRNAMRAGDHPAPRERHQNNKRDNHGNRDPDR